jgi:hypothetical protein
MIPMDRPLFEKEEKGMKYQFGQRKVPTSWTYHY